MFISSGFFSARMSFHVLELFNGGMKRANKVDPEGTQGSRTKNVLSFALLAVAETECSVVHCAVHNSSSCDHFLAPPLTLFCSKM